DGDAVTPNQVLVAPGGMQMALERSAGHLVARVKEDPPVNRHRPSVDYLFESAVRMGLADVVAILLTGMGADGAQGMQQVPDRGARTIAQDQETCVVYGMPREAVERGAAEFVKPLDEIAETAMGLVAGLARKHAA